MKHLSQKTGKNGKTVVTIELDAGESLIGINQRNYYELGEPLHGDVMAGWPCSGEHPRSKLVLC